MNSQILEMAEMETKPRRVSLLARASCLEGSQKGAPIVKSSTLRNDDLSLASREG
jgi:hypothetical protein